MAHGMTDDAHPRQVPDTASARPAPADHPGPDPDRLARLHLFGAVQRDAAPDGATAQGIARGAAAMLALADRAGDQRTREQAGGNLDSRLHLLATAPALTVADVAAKAAALVADLARSGSYGELSAGTPAFILAACVLADLTLLRDGAITLPPRALDPVEGPEIAAHWRGLAEAAL
jgi:hypothetical protein